MPSKPDNLPYELDHREGDGIAVTLLWYPEGDVVEVVVDDFRTGAAFALVVDAHERALDAFRHPFAYAAAAGVPLAVAEPELVTQP